MRNSTITPMAEAKVQIRTRTGAGWSDWRDMIEVDPIQIPVETMPGWTAPYLTDAFDAGLYGLLDALLGYETADAEFDIVWSETGRSVKACCALCDDIFPVSEGAPGDTLNEGVEAIHCGCYDD